MTEDPIKIHLDSSTYVTKVNGKLVFVRQRRERLRDICLDLLGEAFGKYSQRKMKDGPKKPEDEKVPAQNPTATPFLSFPTPPLYNPNANLMGPAPAQSIMGPMGPQPGIYRYGNRQLALLPLNPQGGPAITPQLGYQCHQPPWMFPQVPNINGFNFPPNGIDPQQFITNSAPPSEAAGKAAATVTKHICAECGKLRSRKYQHENPLKPGETPPPALCKRCQKDLTSTEESDSSIRNTEKHRERFKKGHKKKSKVKDVVKSSDESIESNESRKVSESNVIQKESRNQPLDGDITPEEKRAESSHRRRRTYLFDDHENVARRDEVSPMPAKAFARHARSAASSQDLGKYPPVHHSRTNRQAQRSSRESVATDAAEAFHHSRRAPSQLSYKTYESDRVSKHSRSNEDSESSGATPHGSHNFEGPIISTSRTRSEEASRRRRFERSTDCQGLHREATGLPSGVIPSEEDEVVVVTERYVIKPRPLPHVPKENLESHRHNSVDIATERTEKLYPRFVAEAEASEYYRNDWSRAGELDKGDHQRVHPGDLEGLIPPVNSHNSDTSSSSRYRARTDSHYLPRAPSSLSPPHREGQLRAQANLSRHDVSYTQSENESLPWRGYQKYTIARDQATTRGRSNNTYRPPYVREATDRGTERALIPSPKHSHEKMFYPDTNDSEITEEIERVERRVTFRDPEGYENGYEDGYDILSGKSGSTRVLRDKGRR